MGCWDVYCPLCGLPLNTINSNDIQKSMYECTILFNSNKIMHNAREVACNINFHVKKEEFNNLINNPKSFIVMHTDCWKYIKKEKNIELKYSDFPIVKKLYNENSFFNFNISYKPISNYWNQDFDVINFLKDGGIIDSPLKNSLQGKFINNIFKKLDIKIDRKGPRVSATLYEEGDLLIGTDNIFWQIKNNKWIKTDTFNNKFITNIKINEKNKLFLESVYNHFNYKYIFSEYKNLKLFKLPRLGEVSKINLIIKDINFLINKNNWNITINVIYTEKGLKKWNELIKYNFYLF